MLMSPLPSWRISAILLGSISDRDGTNSPRFEDDLAGFPSAFGEWRRRRRTNITITGISIVTAHAPIAAPTMIGRDDADARNRQCETG